MSIQTRKGKLVIGGVCAISVGFASANFIPHTFLLPKLQEIVQMYRGGVGMPITQRVSQTIECVMNDMKISSEDRKSIQPFTVYGFDVFHAGYCRSQFGSIIGIPSTFYYSGLDDVETQNITVRNRHVDWISEAGQNFKQSLILSEEAQKFLIAREIAAVQTPQVFLKSTYPILGVLLSYSLAYKINRHLQLLQRPPMLRSIMYTIVGLFGFGVWAFMQDITTAHFEKSCDEAVCSLSKEYLRGGLEAYAKIQQRNISLREIMGADGAKTYSAIGNNIYFFRQKHIPISQRKEFLEFLANKEKEIEKKPEDNLSTENVL